MTKITMALAARIMSQPRLLDNCSCIPANNLSASVRLIKVIPMKADIRDKENKKRLGAIFFNI